MAQCPVCESTPLNRLSGKWWSSRRCGICRRLVCRQCIERPIVVGETASYNGIQFVCKACFTQRVQTSFDHSFDVYEFSGLSAAAATAASLPVVPAPIRETTIILLHGATAGKESLASIAKVCHYIINYTHVLRHRHHDFTCVVRSYLVE